MRRRALVALAASIGSLLAAEVALRAVGYGDDQPGDIRISWQPRSPLMHHPTAGHRLDANWVGTQRYERVDSGQVLLDVPVATDDDGLRATPGSGERTLLVVGDSLTFGQGVGAEETFVAQLDAALPGWTVRNGGVPAWGLAHEVAWLADGPAADAVLVASYHNDHLAGTMRGQDRPVVKTPTLRPAHPIVLIRVFERALEARELAGAYYGDDLDASSALVAALADMERLYGELGPDTAVALLPAMTGDGPDMRAALAGLGDAASSAGLPVMDATSALDGLHPREARVHPADPHPSAAAHRAIAEALTPSVRSWLDGVATAGGEQ
ncbi:MAG: hypothetical protein GY913_34240 [Proteobacteria bacterium]|nr:hypothetical protein [Pseudomonadota bacterium]MCP4921989.1 hypothetical protein [Pseudomonadota bacterium]